MTDEIRYRPRYEGANIRTWIGFKHFMYIVEEAVLDWFRANTPGPHRLYHEHGLGLEIVDASVQLPSVLEVDDEVRAEVEPRAPGRFEVRLYTDRPVLRGKVTVALAREADPPDRRPYDGEPRPVDLGDGEPVAGLPGAPATFRWDWRAPYFYCHYSDRVQHSAYVRALEEVVDRFLADRGISVGHMLADRGWIPVVSRARVRLLGAAHMEETVHTTFTVEDILRDTMFDGRMDCYVRRGDGYARVATATILHGYAISRGPDAGGLARLDDVVVKALTGGGAG